MFDFNLVTVICIDNRGNEDTLTIGKEYRGISNPRLTTITKNDKGLQKYYLNAMFEVTEFSDAEGVGILRSDGIIVADGLDRKGLKDRIKAYRKYLMTIKTKA